MERSEWLEMKRRAAEERYDRLWAPIYDENWGSQIDPIHERNVKHITNTCPEDGYILDAACGTGKYWPILLASKRDFMAIDQSQGMIDHARLKFPQVKVEKLGLQEMQYKNMFDLILCMDAMEMIFPEDWMHVLNNFRHALKENGQLYFTVELVEEEEVERDYQAAIELGLPVVRGEAVFADEQRKKEGGYHYYPSMEQVRQWLDESGFSIIDEEEGGDYHHFWVMKQQV